MERQNFHTASYSILSQRPAPLDKREGVERDGIGDARRTVIHGDSLIRVMGGHLSGA